MLINLLLSKVVFTIIIMNFNYRNPMKQTIQLIKAQVSFMKAEKNNMYVKTMNFAAIL
jgi:hypothetical protein